MMLGRRIASQVSSSCLRSSSNSSSSSSIRRWYAAEPEAPKGGVVSERFMELWRKVAPPVSDPPKTPAAFMSARPPTPATIPEKLTVNFVLPHEVTMEAEKVDMVIIPATAGMMGVLPGHVPTIAELKPGVMSVHEGGQVKTQYFLSSGFAFIHSNSVTDIVAVEAAPLDQFEAEEVRKSLAEYQQKLSSARDDLEKAQAQIGIEVYSSLAAALNLQ